MEQNLKPGQKIRITLTEGDEYEGTLHFVNATSGRISVYNIKDVSTNQIFNSMYYYMRNEIRRIEIISDIKKKQSIKPAEVILDEIEKKFMYDPDWDRAELTLNLPANEIKRLKHMQTSVEFITEINDNFRTAVYHLKNCESVGIDVRFANFEHTTKLTYLIIASLTQVYVFDMKVLRAEAFDHGLRFILQTEYIIKVIHNGVKLSNVLMHNFRIPFRNIFDTQIADCMIRSRQHDAHAQLVRRSLSECLVTYLDAPRGYNCEFEEIREWNQRPLREDLQLQIGERAALLISLRNQLQRCLDDDFYRMTDTFMSAIAEMDPGEAFYCLTNPDEKLLETFDKLSVSS